ncbi:cytochrome c biogenesis protein CcsA [Sulfurospirillum diekertiae]|uniref:Nitrite reductase cytochrome c biogenesis protein NrfI n=1 Tax=Sulfurospirillum diekertiae TaxID=1854492 RepID=A0A1Y0HIX8_9BACT|nr:cytochrome c biogenesis protein CcsA [Sulfurospirillum diekertiae]ARU48002.1 nitrite reductase cytochrome c biogenesis protein NrfI [Sulfurospirillum diekertiae]ASC92849.1 nitrite reductase cytochrome c biogenesis protein NrfI [Sulfurospirillum diekertiae]
MLLKVFGSYKTTLFLLFILAVGAAVATFVENDFGTAVARHYVYNAIWYEAFLTLGALNLAIVLYRSKMFLHVSRFVFHATFILILIGAGLTHFLGVDGVMKIREGSSSNVIFSNDKNVEITLPFAVHLNHFELERYYGSRSPSAYTSDVRVLDGNMTLDAQIFMNHTLTYKGYKFFQTFYDPDEKGTILSVTKDPGVEVTYVGYALLFLGLIFNLLDPKSRFRKLIAEVKSSSLLVLLVLVVQTPLWCESEYVQNYLSEHQVKSKVVSDAFGKLVVQSRMGRMKPFDTLSQEVLYKLSGHNSLYDMDAMQIALGMLSHPTLWKNLPMIQTKTPKLRAFIGVRNDQKLASFNDFFDGHRYKLEAELQKALAIKPSQRGTFENDLIKVDERLSIAFMLYQGVLFKIFPLPNDTHHTWLAFEQMFAQLEGEEAETLKESSTAFIEALFERDYDKALLHVKTFSQFQTHYGADIMPSPTHINMEILFNKLMLFERLTMAYVLLGLVLLGVAFGRVFAPQTFTCKLTRPLFFIVAALFVVHTCGLALRWYVSGHAPLSDTYESIVYIAWSCLLFCMLFMRRSLFALSGSVMMAGIFMFVAHLGHIDPEITNLVPVLKSFWLSVHVSIITASYGFLALGCALGFFTLILFTCKRSTQIIATIKHLTSINEITLILGLSLLVIGNFLGGIWANESWGRYWGWDPKETWAYISILVYTFILHVRLVPRFYSHYLFAVLSLLGFASILMTYFGVNFYLAGMHSYATGDPVPIPTWVYVCSGVVACLIVLSYKNKNLKEEK